MFDFTPNPARDEKITRDLKYFFVCGKGEPAGSSMCGMQLRQGVRIISILGMVLNVLLLIFAFLNFRNSIIFSLISLGTVIIDFIGVAYLWVSTITYQFRKAYIGYGIYTIMWLVGLVNLVLYSLEIQFLMDHKQWSLSVIPIIFFLYKFVKIYFIWVIFSWTKNLGRRNKEAIPSLPSDLQNERSELENNNSDNARTFIYQHNTSAGNEINTPDVHNPNYRPPPINPSINETADANIPTDPSSLGPYKEILK